MSSFDSILKSVTDWWLQNGMFDPGGPFQFEAVFEESYVVRAALQVAPTLATGDRASLEGGAFAFCSRVVGYQGVQGPPEALFMGYGLKIENGMVELSCIADQASIANAVLETFEQFPNHSDAPAWRQCVVSWTDWVLANFVQANGGVGVGIFNHQWNPIKEYWCATSLFTATLFKLARLLGPDRYLAQAMKGLDWLSQFDFFNADIPKFADVPANIILYTMDGISEGIRYLRDVTGLAENHPAMEKYKQLANWLVQNQLPTGLWPPEPPQRGNRGYSAGLPWQLLYMNRLIGPESAWVNCAERLLQYLSSAEGQRYFGLFDRPWEMGLSWLSLAEAVRHVHSLRQFLQARGVTSVRPLQPTGSISVRSLLGLR
jgi:Glycosyl hydrolase family 76